MFGIPTRNGFAHVSDEGPAVHGHVAGGVHGCAEVGRFHEVTEERLNRSGELGERSARAKRGNFSSHGFDHLGAFDRSQVCAGACVWPPPIKHVAYGRDGVEEILGKLVICNRGELAVDLAGFPGPYSSTHSSNIRANATVMSTALLGLN